ncbi:MAG: AtpZ/AtpI family protein [Nitrospirota bacterium]
MEEKDRKLLRVLGALSTVGITLVVATVIGYYIGHYLDGRYGTTPWLTLAFLLLGVAAGFKNLYDQTRRLMDLDKDKKGNDGR